MLPRRFFRRFRVGKKRNIPAEPSISLAEPAKNPLRPPPLPLSVPVGREEAAEKRKMKFFAKNPKKVLTGGAERAIISLVR